MRLLIRSEEHTSELQHTIISYAVFCLKKKKKNRNDRHIVPPDSHEQSGARDASQRFVIYSTVPHAVPFHLDKPFRVARLVFFLNDRAPPEIYPLSPHDALPI